MQKERDHERSPETKPEGLKSSAHDQRQFDNFNQQSTYPGPPPAWTHGKPNEQCQAPHKVQRKRLVVCRRSDGERDANEG
jgi:hypothetical protein